jgi:hypothetical protein
MRGRRIPWFFLLVLMLAILSLWSEQAVVYASPPEQEICYSSYEWQELEMGSFVLVFPVQETGLAQQIFSQFPEELETLMANYSLAFESKLVLPVTIRIYPTYADFYCVNPLVPRVGIDSAHSHVGQREIALFSNVVRGDIENLDRIALHGFQHELAILFAEKLTEGYAPPGLLEGLGGYAENPQETFARRFEVVGSPSAPEFSLQAAWDEEAPLSDEKIFFESITTVAYLIDVHGWGKFLQFFDRIRIEQGYRQAVAEVYGVNLQSLQAHWKSYFTVYVEQRWEANVFHSLDLDVFRQLISSGAYSDSIPGLIEAASLIEIFGTQEQLQAARQLLEKAEKGARAGELTLQSRQALLSGRYVESFTSAEEAITLYHQLGDNRRSSELEIYQAIAQEVLDLRAGLEVISEQGIGISPFKSQEVFDMGQRLIELGDLEGVSQAERILLLLGAGRNTFFQFLISVFVFISIGLIIRRILTLRKPPPPEADLL